MLNFSELYPVSNEIRQVFIMTGFLNLFQIED